MLEDMLASRPAPVNSVDLVDFLRQVDFDLLHFACHGNVKDTRVYDAYLELQDSYDANAQTYKYDGLTANQVRFYARLRDRPMVFINACETGRRGRVLVGTGRMAETFVRKGAGAVIAALWAVGDGSALTFSRSFYEAFRNGETLTKATIAGRAAARKALEPTWLAYTVYGHPYARLQREPANRTPKTGQGIAG
jgi:CHAT domain-containing protein